jgi:hypothetical protein
MKNGRAADFILPCLFLCGLILSLFCAAGAQNDDYPPVKGNPDAWATGQGRLVVPEQGAPPGPADNFSAPEPRGNEGLNQPNVPAGDAEEKYTGTKPFGGIGGTGITETGPEENR